MAGEFCSSLLVAMPIMLSIAKLFVELSKLIKLQTVRFSRKCANTKLIKISPHFAIPKLNAV